MRTRRRRSHQGGPQQNRDDMPQLHPEWCTEWCSQALPMLPWVPLDGVETDVVLDDYISLVAHVSKGYGSAPHPPEAWPGIGDATTPGSMWYAWRRWCAHQRRVLYLTPALVDMLRHTDVPARVDVLPKLPWGAFYVALPRDNPLRMELTDGRYVAEGFYVAACQVYTPQTFASATHVMPVLYRDMHMRRAYRRYCADSGLQHALLLAPVGQDRNRGRSAARDDALYTVTVTAGSDVLVRAPREKLRSVRAPSGEVHQLLAVMWNLLLVLSSAQQHALRQESVPGVPGQPTRRSRRANQCRLPYFRLAPKRSMPRRKSEAQESYDGPTHEVLTRGHWARRWALIENVPQGAQVLATREQDGRLRGCYWRWIEPYMRVLPGDAPETCRRYNVNAPTSDDVE